MLVVIQPEGDEALGLLFGAATSQPGALPAQQAGGVQAPLTKATRDQAMTQLAEAQKAIDAIKRLLANPTQ